MQIYIDSNALYNYLSGNPFIIFYRLFINGGWLVLLISLIWGFYFAYLYYKRRKVIQETEYKLFAIDIPKDNEQSIKAIEELFNTLHGMKSGKTMWEIYILGFVQPWFHMEIISIEGYIQFLIRTPARLAELLKSAVYAQYPDADLTEVEDYMSLIPIDSNTKKSKYKCWGMNFFLEKPNYLPLKTYISFEHSLTQLFIDPMASLLEIMSKMGPGEFAGIMIMIQPISNEEIEGPARKRIDDIMGNKAGAKKTIADRVTDTMMEGVDYASEAIYKLWGDVEERPEGQFPMFKMLTPGERAMVNAIETKIKKLNFKTVIKTCYIAPKEKFSYEKGYYGIQGAFKQFDDYNVLKSVKTKADYILKLTRLRWKVRRFLRRYKERNFLQSKPMILSTEELATLYHFPQYTVKAPLIKKAETKTVEPPTGLPLEENIESELVKDRDEREKQEQKKEKEIDKQLEQGEVIDLDLDSKYFESRFAKDKDERIKFKKEFEKEEKELDKKPPKNLPIKKSETKDNTKKTEPPTNLPFVE